MNTYIIIDEGPNGLGTCAVSADDVRGAVEQAVKVYGIEPANVLAIIKK